MQQEIVQMIRVKTLKRFVHRFEQMTFGIVVIGSSVGIKRNAALRLHNQFFTQARILSKSLSNKAFYKSLRLAVAVGAVDKVRTAVDVMNEDELQSRYGKQIDILNPEQVVAAIRAVRASLDVPTLVCHSAYWALAYGKPQPELRRALLAGVCMASTRFRLGDSYNRQDYMLLFSRRRRQ